MGEVTFNLTQAERAEIDKALNGQGGYQTLLAELQNQVQPDGSLTVDDEQLGRIVRMCRWERRLSRQTQSRVSQSRARLNVLVK